MVCGLCQDISLLRRIGPFGCSGRKWTSVLENVLGYTVSATITVLNSYSMKADCDFAQCRGRRSGSMVFHSDEVNRFAYVPKDWMDELSSQHRCIETSD
jgi:hypothetical protein